jgi:hypothetical protein
MPKTIMLMIAVTVLLVAATSAVAFAVGRSMGDGQSRQEVVAARGAVVMPFDQNLTTHAFEQTATGGVETVTANDASDATQVDLIRSHLQKEADLFSHGDFSDPAAIHGMQMPGLAELSAGAARLRIQFEQLPGGARLTYASDDPSLIDALHRWFQAQLSDHGSHAHG